MSFSPQRYKFTSNLKFKYFISSGTITNIYSARGSFDKFMTGVKYRL